jgi:hypothetical protein
MGMVFKNVEYMNGGCFENLSGTSVPKSIGRGPPPGNDLAKFLHFCDNLPFEENLALY